MKASAMPEGEDLATLGRSGATLAIHLSIRNLKYVEAALTPHYGADCPVAVVYRASWPDQLIIRGTLADIREKVRARSEEHTSELQSLMRISYAVFCLKKKKKSKRK